jgi:hypothetical protein
MAAKNHSDFNSDVRLALLEQTNEHIYEVLCRMEKRFDKIDERLDKIDAKFDGKLDKLNSKVDAHFYTLITLYIGGFAGMFAIMAKGFHWF